MFQSKLTSFPSKWESEANFLYPTKKWDDLPSYDLYWVLLTPIPHKAEGVRQVFLFVTVYLNLGNTDNF